MALPIDLPNNVAASPHGGATGNPHLIRLFETLSEILSLFVLLLGISVLLGWKFDITFLKSVLPNLPAMKVNAALGLILLSASLWMLQTKRAHSPAYHLAARLCSSMAILIGALTLLEYATGWNIGIDQLFIKESVSAQFTPHPGRPSMLMALNMVLAGFSIMNVDARDRYGIRPGHAALTFVGITSLLTFLAHMNGVPHFLRFLPGDSAIAFNAAFGLIALTVAILFARPASGAAAILISDTAGGVLVRRMLFPSIIVMIVIDHIINAGVNAGLYDTNSETVIHNTLLIAFFTGIIIATAKLLERADVALAEQVRAREKDLTATNLELERRVGERTSELVRLNEDLTQSEERYREIFQSSNAIKLIIDPGTLAIIDANNAAGKFYGYSREKLLSITMHEINTMPSEEMQNERESVITGNRDHYFFRHRLASGEIRDVESFPSVIIFNGKKVIHSIVHDVTERRETEEKLRQSEERFQILSDAVFEGVAIHSDGIILDCNKAYSKILGYEHSEIIGLPVLNTVAPEFHDEIKKRMASGYDEPFETVATRKDGTRIAVQVFGRWISYKGLRSRCTIIQDITARKLSEEALRQSEEMFRALFNAITETVFIMERSGVVLAINETGAQRLGKRPEEVVGKSVFQIIPEEVARRRMKVIDQVFESGETVRMEDQRGNIWFDQTYYPVKDIEGHATMLATFAIDVTARKEAENRQRELTILLHSVLDAIPAAVFWKNVELRYLGCNSRHAVNVGLKAAGQIINKTDFDFFPPELAEKYRADDRKLMQSAEAIIGFEESYVSPDGQTHYVSSSKVPLSDHEGNVSGIVGAYEDITERKRGEERLREAMIELEHANQELREFVYIASHDLQEPLRKVSGFGDRLKKHLGSGLDEKGADYLVRMTSAAERMSQLIEDLLAFSRVTTRAKSFEPVNLSAVLKEVLEDLEVAISEKGAAITAADSLPVINADHTQMRQLLQNLIGNSVKFCSIKEPCRIAIQAVVNDTVRELRGKQYVAGELLLISVEDNGIGFDEKYADRIFGVFQRLHGRGEYKGTGVGLAICKKIIERHNGEIEARSKPGEGSRFTVILPLHHTKQGGK